MKLAIIIASAFALTGAPDLALAGNTKSGNAPNAAQNRAPATSTSRDRLGDPRYSPPRGGRGEGGDRGAPTVRDHRDGVGRGGRGNGAGGRR